MTDVVTLDGPFGLATARYLIAVRQDAFVGWRQRFPNAEIGLRAEYTLLQGKLNTPGGALLSRGGIPGVGVDGAIFVGNWRLSAGGDYLSGNVARQDQYGPDFAQQSGNDPATLYGAGIRGAGRFGIVVVDVGLFWERAKVPWVSLAVLGIEQRLFDNGFRPASDNTSKGLDLHARIKAGPGVFVQIFGRFAQSKETVTFTDALDSRPPSTIAVRAPLPAQYAFGLGIMFSLGSAGTPNPVP
jgi:hypothetical protein